MPSRVLVVEDDDILRMLTLEAVGLLGLSVEEFTRADDALIVSVRRTHLA